jgi:hypothetical protein
VLPWEAPKYRVVLLTASVEKVTVIRYHPVAGGFHPPAPELNPLDGSKVATARGTAWGEVVNVRLPALLPLNTAVVKEGMIETISEAMIEGEPLIRLWFVPSQTKIAQSPW